MWFSCKMSEYPYNSLPFIAGKNTLQFPLSRRRNTSDSEITRADLWILVWRKEKKHKKKNFRQLRKRRKGKLIRIRIYSVMNKESTKVAELRTKVQKTKWYKISLPISLLKNLESSQKQLMVLRVECKRCNRKTQIIFPRRPKAKCRKTGRKNKDSKRGMNKDSKGKHRRRGCGTARLSPPAKHSKHRPFIVIEQGWKGSRRLRRSAQVMTSCGTSSSSEGVLGVLTGRSPANSCCKVSSYVDFSDMDLDDDIVSPAGYTAATCVGTCARRRRNISSSRSSRNRRSRRVSRRSRRRSRGRGKGHGGRNSNRGYCTADESSPLTVWIFNDDHDLVRAKLPGLVVRSCRCT